MTDETTHAKRDAQGSLILVVDDDEDIRSLLVVVLNQIGMETLAAGDGAAAVRLVRGHPAMLRCVILDVHMPVLGGLEAARIIRGHAPNLAIILIGSYFPNGYQQQIASLDIDHVMQKPFCLSELCETVQGIRAGALPEERTGVRDRPWHRNQRSQQLQREVAAFQPEQLQTGEE